MAEAADEISRRGFDAVVSDVVMDGRSAGEEILAATRELHPNAVTREDAEGLRVRIGGALARTGDQSAYQVSFNVDRCSESIQRPLDEQQQSNGFQGDANR